MFGSYDDDDDDDVCGCTMFSFCDYHKRLSDNRPPFEKENPDDYKADPFKIYMSYSMITSGLVMQGDNVTPCTLLDYFTHWPPQRPDILMGLRNFGVPV